MVAFSKICLAATAAVGALAAPTEHGPLVTFGQLKSLPAQWTAQGQADKGAVVKAQIGLKQNNIKGLQEKLLDISNPSSSNYGKWLSQEEIAKYTAPVQEHVAAVKSWLAANGITKVNMPTNDWIEFDAPVHTMEKLLGAKYEWFTHGPTGLKVPRTTKYSVPQSLHNMIDLVTPTTAFYHNLSPNVHSNGAAAGNLVSPSSIRSSYNVDYNSTGSQLVGTTGFIGVGASHDDFAAFGKQFVPGLKDFKDVSVNGGENSGDGSQLEGNLDTQYAGGVGHPNPSEYLATAPTGSDDQSFNDALSALGSYLNSQENPPSVVSTSYGGEERTLDGTYLDRICNEFMKAGSRGVSIFFSSGDNGVAGNGEASCKDGFYGTWPASCPYITSVGGTEFSGSDEVVANFQQYAPKARSPGGGYSEHFPAPDYNKNVTTAYAQSLDSSTQGLFKAENRGYPDISLISVQFQVNVGGQTSQVLGTSASSPSVAGLVSLLNDYLHSKGKPSLGFLNPLLYSEKASAAIRDVTSGSNFGCDSDGFPAKQGWDAASGLGSFDFAKLRAAL